MTKLQKRFIVILCVIAGFVNSGTAGAKLDPNQPYTGELRNPVTYNVSFSIVFTPPYHTKLTRVWMIRPPTLVGQIIEDYTVTPKPISNMPDPLYGNRLICFQFDHPNGGQIITQHYHLTNYEIYWNIDPAKIINVEKYPPSFNRYLRSEQKVVVNDEIRSLAQRVVGDTKNPYDKAKKVMLYVIDTLTYSHELCSLQASSLHALVESQGHCSDYHGFCTALLRAVGVPARVHYGISTLEKKKASPSHCKLEVYLAPYGWVSFDVSETDKLLTKLEQDKTKSDEEKSAFRQRVLSRLFSGFKDNTWYGMAAGTDYPLVPKPTVGNPPLIRTAYIECDGRSLKDPDPSNPNETLFAWHILADWRPNRKVICAWSY